MIHFGHNIVWFFIIMELAKPVAFAAEAIDYHVIDGLLKEECAWSELANL